MCGSSNSQFNFLPNFFSNFPRLTNSAFFPKYENENFSGAIAEIVVEGNTDRFVNKNGFFVIEQSGDSARILIDKKFPPGIVDTIRFLNRFGSDAGNYTTQRHKLFKDISVKDIVLEIKGQRIKSI